MAKLEEDIFIATSRDHYLPTENAHITTRLEASRAPVGSDENKIHIVVGNIDFLTKTITEQTEDTDFYHKYLKRTMLNKESLEGGADYEYQCSFMNIAFANILKLSLIHI